jgi:hypothetical protein
MATPMNVTMLRLVSALGQKKQTCAPQEAMSALPRIATAKADSRKRSCPLYPRKRTRAVQLGMCAMGQKRTCDKDSSLPDPHPPFLAPYQPTDDFIVWRRTAHCLRRWWNRAVDRIDLRGSASHVIQ